MDHRADAEASRINATKHELLNCVGGKVSLEMQCPKLLWLKENLPDTCWSRIGKLFDLPDFLTWKCTGDDTRSLCSVVCKWNYDGINGRWSTDFFTQIGLSDLCKNHFNSLGHKIREPGSSVGHGLTESAARELGLLAGTPVATSMIDAHAGALCLFGCKADGITDELSSKKALICGTSSCHMSVGDEPIWADGRLKLSLKVQRYIDYNSMYFHHQVFGVHTKVPFSRTCTFTKVAKVPRGFCWITLSKIIRPINRH